MKKLVIRTLLVLGLSFTAMYADNCKVWNWDDIPITMNTCANSIGKSGYLVKKNNSPRDVKLCWEVTFENGKIKKRCQSKLKAYQESRSSSYSMGQMDVIKLRITKFKYLDGKNKNKTHKKQVSILGKWSIQVKQPSGKWTYESIILKNNGKASYIASNGESYLAKWTQNRNSIKVGVFGSRTYYDRNDPAFKMTMNIQGSKFTGNSFVPSAGVTMKIKGQKK